MKDSATNGEPSTSAAPASDSFALRSDALRSAETNQRAVNKIRALVIGLDEPVQKSAVAEDPEQSAQLGEDPFSHLTSDGMIIEPPFDMLTLSLIPEHSTEMRQVLDAMETNIDGFGHRYGSRVKLDDDTTDALKKAVHAERVRLENFFAYAAGLELSFTQLRRRTRRDLESTGNGFWEVIRSAKDEIQSFEHMASFMMRLTLIDDEPIEVDVPTLQLQVDGSVEVKTLKTWKRFRRYVQSRAIFRRSFQSTIGHGMVWFKEFGDPRVYDNQTGRLVPDEEVKDWEGTGKPMPLKRRANEVIHHKLYASRTPYGLPRYIGALLSIFGDRAADEINFTTFKNNNVPSMMILVSNGALTEGTIERINSFVESNIQTSDNRSKFLIVEAEPAGDDFGEDAGQVKINVEKLTSEQVGDALFQRYQGNNADKVRRVWRIPPIFVGRSDDYTRATADSSRRLADEQIFAPERIDFDEFMNRRIFPIMGIVYHRFQSNSPNTTDNTELVKILAGAEKTGGMTPRIARIVLEDILGIDLPDFPEDFDADLPFSLAMAEAVKNKADPTEPGQQVTSIKDDDAVVNNVRRLRTVEDLLGLREDIEREWIGDVKGG